MKKLLTGILIGITLPFLSAAIFIAMGGMPVATKGRPLPLEHFIASKAIHRAMGGEVDRNSPIPGNEDNLAAGAKIYNQQCAVCHGSPDQPPSAIAKGMFPAPPALVGSTKGVTDDSAGESYWKVKNGIRLTGMPGYQDSLTDTELWQVSLLVQGAHALPPAVKAALRTAGTTLTQK